MAKPKTPTTFDILRQLPHKTTKGKSDRLLEIVTDTGTMGTVGDNQLNLVSSYGAQSNMTHLQVQYDTNATYGASVARSLIEFNFDGDVPDSLTPVRLTFI